LKRWFFTSLKNSGSVDARKNMWKSAVKHLLSDQGWKHSQLQEERLGMFIEETTPLFDLVQCDFSTQINECFHAMRAKFASKGISWKNSWAARTAVAILNFNEGPGWALRAFDELRDRFGWVDLMPDARARLTRMFEVEAKRRARQRQADYVAGATASRLLRRGRLGAAQSRAARGKVPMHRGSGPSGASGSSDEPEEVAAEPAAAPHSVDVGGMLVGSAGYAVATFRQGSVYVGWHGLTNPDLHRCHLNASVVALTALGVVASIVLNGLEGAVGQALSKLMVAGSRGRASSQGVVSALEGRSRRDPRLNGMMPQGYFRSHQDARDSTLGLVHALDAGDTETGKDRQIMALMPTAIDEPFEWTVRGGCGHEWSTVKVRESLVFDALRLNAAVHLDLEEAIVPELEEVNGWECPACGEKRALTKSGRVREWPRVLMITHERSMYDFEDKSA
jgi:hypothetical protein